MNPGKLQSDIPVVELIEQERELNQYIEQNQLPNEFKKELLEKQMALIDALLQKIDSSCEDQLRSELSGIDWIEDYVNGL